MEPIGIICLIVFFGGIGCYTIWRKCRQPYLYNMNRSKSSYNNDWSQAKYI